MAHENAKNSQEAASPKDPVTHHSREDICTASILWFFWALSALPLLVLITEFGRLDLGACGNEGWYYARLHSHVFLYPITFGLVSTYFLTKPWIRSVNYLRDSCLSRDQKEWKIGIQSVVLIIVTILLVTGISGFFGYSYSSYSYPALWSFAPTYNVLDKIDVGEKGDTKKLREKIEEQCDQNNQKKSEKATKKIIGKITRKTIDEATIEGTIQEKTPELIFSHQSLREQWKMLDATWSHTEVFYRIGHLAMTILFCLLFTTGFMSAVNRQMEIEAEAKGQGRFYVWVALIFASFWVLMRVTFLFEEKSLYGKNLLLEVHGVFLVVFVGLFLLLPILYHQVHKNKGDSRGGGNSEEKDPRSSIILIGIALVEGVVIAVLELGLNDVSPQISKILVFMFGTGSSILSYFAMFTVILVFSIPFILQLLRKEQFQHLKIEQSKVDKNTCGWFKRVCGWLKRKFPYRGR